MSGRAPPYDATHQRVQWPRFSLKPTRVMRKAQREAENGGRPCWRVILSQEVTLAAHVRADAPSSASRGLHTRPTVFLDAESPATHARHTRRTRRHTADIGSGVSTPRGGPRRRRTRQRRRCARRAAWVSLARHFRGTGASVESRGQSSAEYLRRETGVDGGTSCPLHAAPLCAGSARPRLPLGRLDVPATNRKKGPKYGSG